MFGGEGLEDGISGNAAGLYASHMILPGMQCPYCPPIEEVIEQVTAKNILDLHQMKRICMVAHGEQKE